MSEKQPTSPLKNQPPSKRPNSSLGNPILTRGATAINTDSTLRIAGPIILKPIAAFKGSQLPTNAEILQRLFYAKDNADTKMNASTFFSVT